MRPRENFRRVAEKVAREVFPEHARVEWPPHDFVREDTAGAEEIRVVDRSGAEPLFGIARIHGRVLFSPMLEACIRYELGHVCRAMGYVYRGDPNCSDCCTMSHCETHHKTEGEYPEWVTTSALPPEKK